MEGDSLEIIAERFCNLLSAKLLAEIPRPGGIHRYSKGNLLNNFYQTKGKDGFVLELSRGVEYSEYVFGYRKDASKRTARGQLEKINFKTIEKCIKETAMIIANENNGKVNIKL